VVNYCLRGSLTAVSIIVRVSHRSGGSRVLCQLMEAYGECSVEGFLECVYLWAVLNTGVLKQVASVLLTPPNSIDKYSKLWSASYIAMISQ
ncbi:MAG: hypothetical protein ABR568_23545, partial [Pyrinomonadaceae bacterium]